MAPNSSFERQAYVKPIDEIRENMESGEIAAVAETVVRSNLVFRPYDPNRLSNAVFGSKSKTGKDFKKFKKNKIIPGTMKVKLQAVQLKESTKLRELEEQQKAIDAQQRMADELFAETDKKKQQTTLKPTRRRRA